MSKLDSLFAPGKIGALVLKNRIMMPAMGTHTSDAEGYMTDRTIDYYAERAKGGVGLIIAAPGSVRRQARARGRFWIFDDKYIPRLTDLTRAIHACDAKIALQLIQHSTSLYRDRAGLDHWEEIELICPTLLPWLKDKGFREATIEDIKASVASFAEGALRAKAAGFDAVEIHGVGGCIVTEFLSSLTNRRTDEYGGSPENRARLGCEIIAAIRQKVGKDYPIIFRIDGEDGFPGGTTLEETVRQAIVLDQAGADCISVSSGVHEYSSSTFPIARDAPGALIPLAAAVKRKVKVPVVGVGKLDPELSDRVVRQGKVDFVAWGRSLLADPHLANKAREGRLADIRQCIYCNNCLRVEKKGDILQRRTQCTVNPALLREREFEIKPAAKAKKILVAGGGLAGMKAAALLAKRGHQVTLYEQSDRLGGQWNIAVSDPHKAGYASLLSYLQRELKESGAQIVLNQKVTQAVAQSIKPDAVIVATGAVPRALGVPGADSKHVAQANDVLTRRASAGSRVVVIGGRFEAMEVAELLREQGKHVSLVTRSGLGGKGVPLEPYTFRILKERLVQLGVFIYTFADIREITGDGVVIDYAGQPLFLPADTVVLAVGVTPVNNLAAELKGTVPEVYSIGDCAEPRDARAAMLDAAELAIKL